MGLLKSQLTTLSGGSTNSPVDPNLTLDLEFSSMTVLPASVTFTRASIGTYFDSNGVLQTALAGAARFDHDPVTLEPLGLLIEEARTNALLYSLDCFTGWTGSLVPTVNSTVSPDGTASATLFTATGANQNWFRATSIAAGDTYTFSAFVKRKTGVGVVQMQCAGAGYTAVPVTDIWTRVSVTAAVTSGSKNSVFQINTAGDAVWIWGAQLEAGAFPTSYIPTTSAAVPRAFDSAFMTGANLTSWYTENVGTFAARIRVTPPPTSSFPGVVGKSSNSRWLYLNFTPGTGAAVYDAGTALAQTPVPVGNTTYNIASACDPATSLKRIANNGVVKEGVYNNTMDPAAAAMNIGSYGAVANALNGPIASLKYWDVAKTAAELQEITNPAKY